MESVSESQVLRDQGNLFYRKINDDFCDVVNRNRLSKALTLYEDAADKAETPDDKSSAAKNIAVCYWRLMKYSPPKHPTTLEYVRRSSENFCLAVQYGKKRNAVWRDSLIETFQRFTEEMIEFFKTNYCDNLHDLVGYLFSLAEKCCVNRIRPKLYLGISTVLFNCCVTSLSDQNYKDCLYCIRESYFFIEEVLRCGQDDDRREARTIEQDMAMQEAIALSAQSREIADNLLTSTLQNDESLDMRMIWTVIDHYRTAVIACRELCLESEAHAFSRLAVVYRNVLKCDWRAKECANHVFSLVKSMEPKNFHNFKWFLDAAEILEHYQTEERLKEERHWVNKRKPFIEELKDELAQINEKKKDHRAFFKFVYEKFPPTHKANATLEVDPTTLTDKSPEMKRIVKTAMIHYHPDGVNEEDNGIKHKVLCEEIYKVISCFYELAKGVLD